MRRSTRLAILLFVTVLVVFLGVLVVALSALSGAGPSWSHDPVLYVRLTGEIPEQRSRDPISELMSKGQVDFRDVVDAIERARTDDNIEGLLLDIRGSGLGWAQLEELRGVIERFGAGDEKWSTAFFETAGEFGGASGAYYLATACDTVVLAPPGDIWLTGLAAEMPFLRGALEKLEVTPEFGQRKEYKNAVNQFTEKSFTDAHREAMDAILDSLFDEMVRGVAAGRGLTGERVRELIDTAPHIAEEALAAGLVDRLAYRDELMLDIEERVETEDPLIGVKRYLRGGRPHDSGSAKIALIYGVGAIMRGSSGQDLLAGNVMGSDTVAKAFRRAREQDDVAAVVFRVDSPGGSYVASDLIRRELALTREAGKPVVVSMGNYAASGGYFVSMQADRIFASENTLTGSIGVYMGKFVTREMWNDKLGIRFGELKRGENADFMSGLNSWDPQARERVDALLDRIYVDFVSKAAEGRSIDYDELERLARGRVWTGRDARDRGLVDEIGGLHDALDEARELAGLAEDADYEILALPEPPGALEALFGRNREVFAIPAELRPLVEQLAEFAPKTGERYLFAPGLPRIR